MNNRKIPFDLERVVGNARTLSVPEAYECFLYDDGVSPEDLSEIEGEIEEVRKMIPDGMDILDLPKVFCGNKITKVFGKATCSATEGHLILAGNTKHRAIFQNIEDAEKKGFRPCAKCLRQEYDIWKVKREREKKGSAQELYEGLMNGLYQ